MNELSTCSIKLTLRTMQYTTRYNRGLALKSLYAERLQCIAKDLQKRDHKDVLRCTV